MKKVLSVLNGLLAVFSQLSVPTYATAAAGLVLPILQALGVTDVSVAVLGADIAAFAGAAGAVEIALRKQAAPAPTPDPTPAPKTKKSK